MAARRTGTQAQARPASGPLGARQPRDAPDPQPLDPGALSALLTGIIFLAVFGDALGDRLWGVAGVNYLRFMLPGLLVMTVADQAFAHNSTSLF